MKHTLLCLIIFTLFPLAAVAEDPHPMIGQIQASGATADDEFIELVNPSTQSVDIGSWSIQYKSASGSTYYKKNFSKGASIPGNGTYLIAGSGYTGTYDMKHSSFSLSSAGGTVFLVSNQTLITSSDSPTIIDQKTYNATGTSTNNNANGNTNTNTDPPIDVNPATAAPVAKQPEILTLAINEFMPAPSEGKEWIELYNGTGYAIDLAGWTIADGTEKNFITLSDLIMPAAFKLIELEANHLNNAGDLIILRDANKREIDRVCYGDWECDGAAAPVGNDGVAIARIADGRDTNDDGADFALTATPTPGAANNVTAPIVGAGQEAGNKPNATATTKISKADTQWLADLLSKQNDEIAKLLKADNIIIINNLNIGTEVNYPSKADQPLAGKTVTKTVSATTKTSTAKTASVKTTPTKPANSASGMVIVPAGIVGKDICVVREENRSVEVRLPSDLKQTPIAGDIINTNGTWSTAKTLTLPRLLVKKGTAVIVSDHSTPPEPINIPMSKINEHIGEIITTNGTIVEKQATRLRIADGSDSLLIKTKFEAAKNDKLSATGLLTKDATDTLLTTLAPDALAVIKPPAAAMPSLVQKALPYGIAVVPAGILSTAIYLGKKLKKTKGGDGQ